MVEIEEIVKRSWFLTGATASGKTGVSLSLAEAVDAEIISLDSMAIYRGMDVGTAKPSVEAQSKIAHHLIDICDPNENFSTSQFYELAREKVSEIWGRGKTVLFVGGTALYLKTMLRGLFEGPPADWEFRKEIEDEIAEMGDEFLHQRLKMVDPVAAHNLHPNDHRRIIRALEVFKITGKPLSHLQLEFDNKTDPENCRVFALRHDRAILHQRIEQRVSSMFEKDLLGEVAAILQQYSSLSRTAAQAVGYKEAIDHLNGDMTLDEAIERVRIRTRRFARHQETWFRGMRECEMVDLSADFDEQQTVELLLEKGRQRQV